VYGDIDLKATYGKIRRPFVTNQVAETKQPFYLLAGESVTAGLVQYFEGFPDFSIIRARIGWQQQGQWGRFATGNKVKGFITRN
jgi:hypothetical protein